MAGGTEAITLAFRNAQGLDAARGAGVEGDEPRLMAGPADDAGSRWGERLPGYRDVAELLILVAEVAFLEAAVQRGALHARREMTPVGVDDRAWPSGGAGREDLGTGGKQLLTGIANQGEAARRTRFNDDERDTRGLPQAPDDVSRRRLAQRVGRDDQVVHGKRGHAHEVLEPEGGAGEKFPRGIGQSAVTLYQGDGVERRKPMERSQRSCAGARSNIESAVDRALPEFEKNADGGGVGSRHARREIGRDALGGRQSGE